MEINFTFVKYSLSLAISGLYSTVTITRDPVIIRPVDAPSKALFVNTTTSAQGKNIASISNEGTVFVFGDSPLGEPGTVSVMVNSAFTLAQYQTLILKYTYAGAD